VDEHLRQIYRIAKNDPSLENITLLHAHYKRAGMRPCDCENIRCKHCQAVKGYSIDSETGEKSSVSVCLEPADSNVFIQYIEYSCDACASQISMSYHGHVDFNKSPLTWRACRCSWCRDLEHYIFNQLNETMHDYIPAVLDILLAPQEIPPSRLLRLPKTVLEDALGTPAGSSNWQLYRLPHFPHGIIDKQFRDYCRIIFYNPKTYLKLGYINFNLSDWPRYQEYLSQLPYSG